MREHLTYLRDLVERSARAAAPAADAAHRQPGQSTVEGRGITSR